MLTSDDKKYFIQWIMLTSDSKKYWLQLFKHFRLLLEDLIQTLHPLQANSVDEINK